MLFSLFVVSSCMTPKEKQRPEPWFRSEAERAGFNQSLQAAFEDWRTHNKKAKPQTTLEDSYIDGPDYVYSSKKDQRYEWFVRCPDFCLITSEIGTDFGVLEEISDEDAQDKVFRLSAKSEAFQGRAMVNINIVPRDGEFPPVRKSIHVDKSKGDVSANFQVLDQMTAVKLFGKTFSQAFFCIEVSIDNSHPKPATVNTSKIKLPVFYVSKFGSGFRDDGKAVPEEETAVSKRETGGEELVQALPRMAGEDARAPAMPEPTALADTADMPESAGLAVTSAPADTADTAKSADLTVTPDLGDTSDLTEAEATAVAADGDRGDSSEAPVVAINMKASDGKQLEIKKAEFDACAAALPALAAPIWNKQYLLDNEVDLKAKLTRQVTILFDLADEYLMLARRVASVTPEPSSAATIDVVNREGEELAQRLTSAKVVLSDTAAGYFAEARQDNSIFVSALDHYLTLWSAYVVNQQALVALFVPPVPAAPPTVPRSDLEASREQLTRLEQATSELEKNLIALKSQSAKKDQILTEQQDELVKAAKRVDRYRRHMDKLRKELVAKEASRPAPQKWFLVAMGKRSFRVYSAERTPMNFAAILKTVRYDQDRTPGSIIVRLFRSAGTLASAIIPFVNHADYSTAVAMLQGPGMSVLEKHLLDDLVSNLSFLNDNSLHESLRIEASTSVTKYAFFPKGDIFGRWGMDLPVRIMSLNTGVETSLEGKLIESEAPFFNEP